MSDERPHLPEIPRDVREGDTFGAIERMKRERSRFGCFGMGCVPILLVLVAIAGVCYFLFRG